MAAVKFRGVDAQGRAQVRRARIPALDSFDYKALVALAGEVFPAAPGTSLQLGYVDDEGETIALSSDRDLAELLDGADKRALRIDVLIVGDAWESEQLSATPHWTGWGSCVGFVKRRRCILCQLARFIRPAEPVLYCTQARQLAMMIHTAQEGAGGAAQL